MPDTLPEPSAWVLVEHLEKGQTRYNAYLWFSDPQSSAWMPIYTPEVLAEVRRQALEEVAQAVRFAPSSAHWSEELKRLCGPDARDGITAAEKNARFAGRFMALEEAAQYLESVHQTRLVKFADGLRTLKDKP